MPDSAASPPLPAADLGATPIQDADAREASARLSVDRLRPPGQAPGYELVRPLGAGSFGSVWLARELRTGKQVAIKFYTQRRGLNWSLLSREVEKLALLYTSRNIVGLLDVGWDHDPPFFVMEYLEGGSLAGRLQAGPLPVEEAVRVTKSLARALVHAHQAGILHCDLKPANILLDANGEPRLGDFGQSRLTTELSPALGSVYYMAPEQANLDAAPDVRWDVYALGAVLYEMLTGAPPYSDPQTEARLREVQPLSRRLQAYRDMTAQAPPPERHHTIPGVDLRLAEIIDGCLQRDPAQRYASVQAVLEQLETRDRIRAKRPLIALGFLGPIVFLTAMYWIAERSIPRLVAAAEANLIERALASDVVAAQILADSVQQELRARAGALEQIAARHEVAALLELAVEMSEEELVRRCEAGQARTNAPDAGSASSADPFAWLNGEVGGAEARLAHEGRTVDDSWFVTDATGRQVYRYPPQELGHPRTLGRSFHWRDYFHGQGRDLPPETPATSVPVRTRVGLSAPFRSQASGQFMVALAVPIRSPTGDHVLGVIARTIRLTSLLHPWEAQISSGLRPSVPDAKGSARFLALGDTRGDGVQILDHPGLSQSRLATLSDDVLRSESSPLRVPSALATLLRSEFRCDRYQDPLAALDPAFRGAWLAAAAPVGDTGWLAIVQERREATVQPVDDLRNVVVRTGLWSVGIFSGLLLLLWFLIQRAAA